MFYLSFYLCNFAFKSNPMKFYFAAVFSLFILLISCNNADEQRQAENIREAKKQEIIFENINKSWTFTNPTPNPGSQAIVKNWAEWRLFLAELDQKPKSTIGAFQKKAKTLSKKAADLNNNIPPQFNKPEIKSRILVLMSNINAINLFINLHNIPDQKITILIADVNAELSALTQQMDEVVRKSAIPKEEGESEMLLMLDKTRAIPTVKTDENSPKP